MEKDMFILVINPGSTSTKVAVYNGKEQVFVENVKHASESLSKFKNINDQYEFRYDEVISLLEKNNFKVSDLKAVIGRGGLIKPVESGVYNINQKMLDDLKNNAFMQHASNLGAMIAKKIADTNNLPCFIADPVVVDEMIELARITGRPEIKRSSVFHALNHKAVGRKAAKLLGKEYNDSNLIVVHLGGGISVAAHRNGRVIDVTDALYGDAPMSAERTGRLPTGQLVEMCFAPGATIEDIKRKLVGAGGMVAHCGSNDAKYIEDELLAGNKDFERIYKAIAYQISKDIGAFATVLKGKVDSIVITGGMARSEPLINWITDRVSFIANVLLFPGENEMESLAEAAYRVISGEESPKEYN